MITGLLTHGKIILLQNTHQPSYNRFTQYSRFCIYQYKIPNKARNRKRNRPGSDKERTLPLPPPSAAQGSGRGDKPGRGRSRHGRRRKPHLRTTGIKNPSAGPSHARKGSPHSRRGAEGGTEPLTLKGEGEEEEEEEEVEVDGDGPGAHATAAAAAAVCIVGEGEAVVCLVPRGSWLEPGGRFAVGGIVELSSWLWSDCASFAFVLVFYLPNIFVPNFFLRRKNC